MITCISGLLAGITAYSAATPPLEALLLPEVKNFLKSASSCHEDLNWGESIAYADSLLMLGSSTYKVSFDDCSDEERKLFHNSIEKAASMWEQALKGDFRFQQSDQAPIEIRFQSRIESSKGEIGGHIQWRRSIQKSLAGEYSPKFSATIWVRTRQPNGKPMRLAHLAHVVAHELGHALGLADSKDQGQAMGPLNLADPVTSIAERESAAVLQLRAQATELRRMSLLSALQSLEGYNLPRATR